MPNAGASRSAPAFTNAEREVLEAFLDDYREELVGIIEDLTDSQARRQLVPSLTTPLGLLKHAAAVERLFFQRALAGRSPEDIDGLTDGGDASWKLDEEDTVVSLAAEFRRACDESRSVAGSHKLDDLALHNWRGPLTLRWVFVHMIEEHARHAGHADILREQILAGP